MEKIGMEKWKMQKLSKNDQIESLNIKNKLKMAMWIIYNIKNVKASRISDFGNSQW